jgi:hypothetical protein
MKGFKMNTFDLVEEMKNFTNDYESGRVEEENYHSYDIEYLEKDDTWLSEEEFNDIYTQN